MKMVNWMWKGKDKTKEKGDKKEEEEVDEAELQKKGFNPEGLDIEDAKDEIIAAFDQDYEEFISPTPEELAEILANFKYLWRNSDFFQIKMNPGMSSPTPAAARSAATRRSSTKSDPSARK